MLRIKQPERQTDDRRLAGARGADNGGRRPCRRGEVDVAQSDMAGIVRERDVLEGQLRAMAIYAGLEVLHGDMRIGSFTAAILVLMQVYLPLNLLGSNYREIRQAFIDMEQMLELRAIQPDIRDAEDARDLH